MGLSKADPSDLKEASVSTVELAMLMSRSMVLSAVRSMVASASNRLQQRHVDVIRAILESTGSTGSEELNDDR